MSVAREVDPIRKQYAERMREARRAITLFRAPFTTLKHFSLVVIEFIGSWLLKLWSHNLALGSVLAVALTVLGAYTIDGHHTQYLGDVENAFRFAGHWILLGILSSVGLGTGLHTFVLFLAPYIGHITLAAYRCKHLNFDLNHPETCKLANPAQEITVWSIFMKVQLACLLWGTGTALGELPPYFMARAAAEAGEKLDELEEVHASKQQAAHELTLMDRAKLIVYQGLQKYGFWAILLGASIPNPLFDLAGLASGAFGVPFWTFFSATVIGKAVIKAHGQGLFMVLLVSPHSLDRVVELIRSIPISFVAKAADLIDKKRKQYQLDFADGSNTSIEAPEESMLSHAWNLVLGLMIGYFLVSIVDSLAQQRLVEIDEQLLESMFGKAPQPKQTQQVAPALVEIDLSEESVSVATESKKKASPSSARKGRSRVVHDAEGAGEGTPRTKKTTPLSKKSPSPSPGAARKPASKAAGSSAKQATQRGSPSPSSAKRRSPSATPSKRSSSTVRKTPVADASPATRRRTNVTKP